MLKLEKTNALNTDFIKLVKLLDEDLAKKDGDDHQFYSQFNKIDTIKYVIVAYLNNKAVGCGTIKQYNTTTMEIKRMFTLPNYRGQKIATTILKTLENWALELGYNKCILETGKKQQEAIKLYLKNNYIITPNYGQYVAIANSVCFEKKLAC